MISGRNKVEKRIRKPIKPHQVRAILKRIMRPRIFATLILLLIACHSETASAQLSSNGILDQVVMEFSNKATFWRDAIMNHARYLFYLLGTISFSFTFGLMILRKADIGEFFSELIRFMLFFGFYLWLLENGPKYAIGIINSLTQLGEEASGTREITPSNIVDIGFELVKKAYEKTSIWSPVDSAIGVALTVAVLIMLAAITVNMTLLLIASWMLAYAGIFFLGFGGSKWTSEIAINYYKTILGVAIQIMTMVLLIGVGNDLINTFYNKMGEGIDFTEITTLLVFCYILYSIVDKVPPLVAGILLGPSIGNFANNTPRSVFSTTKDSASTLVTSASSASGGALALAAAYKAGNNINTSPKKNNVNNGMLGTIQGI